MQRMNQTQTFKQIKVKILKHKRFNKIHNKKNNFKLINKLQILIKKTFKL
jgi:hypothetical protein